MIGGKYHTNTRLWHNFLRNQQKLFGFLQLWLLFPEERNQSIIKSVHVDSFRMYRPKPTMVVPGGRLIGLMSKSPRLVSPCVLCFGSAERFYHHSIHWS